MAKKSFESVLCSFFFLSFMSAISVSAQVCVNNTDIFKPDSPYDNNRRLILSTLASNVPAHNGYFNGSFGFGTDRVYAMGMCASGSERDFCSDCFKTTSDLLLESCLNQRDAFAWQGEEILCLVRYSRMFFVGSLGLEPSDVFYNNEDIEKEDLKEFDRVWDGLMSRMIRGVSSYMTDNSSYSKYYAMDVALVPVYGNITSVMQCTPDVTLKDCKFCLLRSVDLYKSKYHGKKGSIILRPSCFFRWEFFTFYYAFDGINEVLPPPTPPSPFIDDLTIKDDRTIKDSIFSGGFIAAIVIAALVFITLIVIGVAIIKRRMQNQIIELPTDSVQFDLKKIEDATSNFSECNKLGEGGFGAVYKGVLMDGTEVAVKRLSKESGQGEVEFKNEVVVVAKLQHRNLVRLLGFSLQGAEKLLIYEYVPNKSLDYFLFDPLKRTQLDWTMRRNIIGGITRGLLYLHQDSRLKIIHRDLKSGNILLDSDMNPKIADFGVARIFGIDQTVANTSRVVGTFGYMPPEYVTHGQFSTKSDVYSYGVLILEIISGKKTSSFYQMDGLVNNLVTYVWRLWEKKSLPELIDPGIREDCISEEVTRYIHIGLLCVQQNPSDRPKMSTIHQMLTTNSFALPVPLPPGFLFTNGPGSNPFSKGLEPGQPSNMVFSCSVDKATITDLTPR